MGTRTPVSIKMIDEHGNQEETLPITASNDDWIRAARLKKQAEQGDKKAQKQFDEMRSTFMYKEKVEEE